MFREQVRSKDFLYLLASTYTGAEQKPRPIFFDVEFRKLRAGSPNPEAVHNPVPSCAKP